MNKFKIFTVAIAVSLAGLSSCKQSFLELSPQGQLTGSQLNSTDGVEQILIGAYGMLNGNRSGTWGNYVSAPSQWLLGEVTADNAHKGSTATDITTMTDLEKMVPTSTNDQLETLWTRCYEGVLSCNSVLKALATLQDGDGAKFDDNRAKEIQAEARFLRAHYYFLLRRVFVKVPYVDETTSTSDAGVKPNDTDIYPQIQADLEFAVASLPDAKPKGEVGRINKKIAQAYLGKVLLYENKHSEALPLFQSVMTASGDLVSMPFENNFQTETENGPEAVFQVQHAISGSVSDNANVGDMLGGFYGSAPVTCCGFYQPTIDLVNAFKVDANGLPMLDNSYRTNPYTSDLQSPGDKSSYVLDKSIKFDPRIDYTVARRGVKFRDWGVMPGDGWIRDPAFSGPFLAQKHTINKSAFGTQTLAGSEYVTGLNVNIIRLADVYLMAAECYIDAGDLDEARKLVNKVRERASKLTHKQAADGTDAASYQIGQYPSFPDEAYALKAVQFERRLELALEGHRFYDLVRWGILKQVKESYSAFESTYLPAYGNIVVNAYNNYFPIPQTQIDRSLGNVKQNDGY
ncbi:MAG: RagB/SusD family nutrient uptake outer membrane protein [Chitinophagaceae bacterium]|nr:RagB/SusD family nutrient uptake outer membrane protein [Chitinophagaceae bacterium]